MVVPPNNVRLTCSLICFGVSRTDSSYTGGPGPQIFIDVDNLNFELGSMHTLTITLVTEGGQSASDTVQFVVASVPDEPSEIQHFL